jgi:hypothetical protein
MTLPANLPQNFLHSFGDYGKRLKEIADSRIANAQPEDQLKDPVQTLLRHAAAGVETRTEVRVSELEARPDIGVAVGRLLCGHVELKAPGLGANTALLKDRNKLQWEKLRALPNILYTDGLEFALYRSGERIGKIVRLGEDLASVGKSATPAIIADLHTLLLDFFSWQPIVPKTARALATMLAPLCRLLREEVFLKLQDSGSSLTLLNANVRNALFPDVSHEQFADIYAQTLTYSLLLARLNGETNLTTESAIRGLESGHSLLASVLGHMANRDARAEVETPVSILERVISAVEPALLYKEDRNPWLYFYEDFLSAYDKNLRGNRGVYYTPVQVIGAQIRLTAELLETRFKKSLAFADDNVFLLDPAAGTCAYPLAAIEHALVKTEKRLGKGAVAAKATQLANNVHAFEILVGPYAVGHLRLTQMIRAAGGELPKDGIHVYLTDTLESPHAETPPQSLFSKPLTDEHRRAANVKRRVPIMVCLGNPPYDRESYDPAEMEANPDLQRKGGWVRHGDTDKEGEHSRPILRDFIEPAQQSGAGKHLKNLYNDYVYFWRWALWKMFENPEARGPGIVTFITASSYLRGPGFVGMRRKMREAFDELWIVDLEGDQLGARKTENVFAIQTPVAIAIGLRATKDRPATPATVRYTRLTGTQVEKLEKLDKIQSFADLSWEDCFEDWEAPMLPKGTGNFFDWPTLTNLFPWQHSGSQFKRTWPIAEVPDVLNRRWQTLVAATDKKVFFRETRDRKIDKGYPGIEDGVREHIRNVTAEKAVPEIHRYAFRSLDRQYCFRDTRLGDFIRPVLWRSYNAKQVYLTSLLTKVLGPGPAATVTCLVPDLDFFSGRGGKDVIPLWRDAEGSEANLTHGLSEALSKELGSTVSPEDVFAYCYAMLSAPAYVETFSEELTIPGPRIPISKDRKFFQKAVALGRKLIWLHTYGERMAPNGRNTGEVPQGKARCVKGIPGTAAEYPEAFSYVETPPQIAQWGGAPTVRQVGRPFLADPVGQECPTYKSAGILRVGTGEIAPVSKEVFTFSVSGLDVVKSWLRYRMKAGAGRSSSPLDEIRPETWTAQMTQELLELLWVLEATVEMQPDLDQLLADVCGGPVFDANDLPTPTEAERRPPSGDDQGVEAHAEFEKIVAEVKGDYSPRSESKTKAAKPDERDGDPAVRKRSFVKLDAPPDQKIQAYCKKCRKVLPQTSQGYPEVKGRTVRQNVQCTKCGSVTRVESRVVR